MAPLIFPINVISELSRLISLSMRLFGNIFAGEVLLATMLALTTTAVFVLPLAFFVPAAFLGLEILFGFVQALVFALLSLTYISTRSPSTTATTATRTTMARPMRPTPPIRPRRRPPRARA